jgi:hypothetical protein
LLWGLTANGWISFFQYALHCCLLPFFPSVFLLPDWPAFAFALYILWVTTLVLSPGFIKLRSVSVYRSMDVMHGAALRFASALALLRFKVFGFASFPCCLGAMRCFIFSFPFVFSFSDVGHGSVGVGIFFFFSLCYLRFRVWVLIVIVHGSFFVSVVVLVRVLSIGVGFGGGPVTRHFVSLAFCRW